MSAADEVRELLARGIGTCGCGRASCETCPRERGWRTALAVALRDAEERGLRTGRALGLAVAREVVGSELRRRAEHALADTLERALVRLAGEAT